MWHFQLARVTTFVNTFPWRMSVHCHPFSFDLGYVAEDGVSHEASGDASGYTRLCRNKIVDGIFGFDDPFASNLNKVCSLLQIPSVLARSWALCNEQACALSRSTDRKPKTECY